jgi:murein DD-endopeptidase MepM/ murein hydrolase activator NlpD
LFAIGSAAMLAAEIFLAGCGSQPQNLAVSTASSRLQQTHVVRRGETLYRIAQNYGVSTAALMRANGLHDPRELRVGQLLVIPSRYESSVIGRADHSLSWPNRPPPEHAFIWPVSGGVVSSPFGIRHGVMHDGIDIAAPVGTPVMAADSGVVVYAGQLRGYGNVVIIQHSNHFATVYGHDAVNKVNVGEQVSRGQVIGKVGDSGRTTGPNLHFEIRHDNLAYNPLAFLTVSRPETAETFASGGGS